MGMFEGVIFNSILALVICVACGCGKRVCFVSFVDLRFFVDLGYTLHFHLLLRLMLAFLCGRNIVILV